MLNSFSDDIIELPSGIKLRVRCAGNGPVVLLLHGYPQTHVCWHKVAPLLVDAGFSVVLSDLRGYGDSDKPPSDENHLPYSKRAMAADQAELMRHLGHETYFVAGHDRGARVAHRLARDFPDAVAAVSFLDIVPTEHMYAHTEQTFATGYYHWFFLIQPAPLPERLIGNEPGFYLTSKLSAWSKGNDSAFESEAVAEYIRCFDAASIHATCEDYRAGASVDLQHDAHDQGTLLKMPVQALWGQKGLVAKLYNVPEVWQGYAENVVGEAMPCGHFLPEEAPEQTANALVDFFKSSDSSKAEGS
ncbi:alpha/beta hydrolase [Sedimentitalea sp. CY04]|uniref:Alpha/beta hydrolase n=1 Tax=Parasedimentitalea denitrificans TaxID=2211118 RepID=A0ABX0WBD4_9RHOB|nr:alpha/beta hydrolase [Sedimentitalea sp. CY04]NIZ62523.1 alpha/beta hydrolase [Sedimentitalea sp. CY04]